jgi:hypothetical protein
MTMDEALRTLPIEPPAENISSGDEVNDAEIPQLDEPTSSGQVSSANETAKTEVEA